MAAAPPPPAAVSSGARPSRGISLRKLREAEARLKVELEQATLQLGRVREEEAILEQRTLDVRRALVAAEQQMPWDTRVSV